MAALTAPAANKLTLLFPGRPGTRARNKKTAVALTAGQPAYVVATTGLYGIADAAVSGKEQFRGLPLETVGAGEAVTIVEEGEVGGFDLSALNYDAIVYLQDGGGLGTTAGTKSVPVGRVVALADAAGPPTKVLRIGMSLLSNF